MDIADPHKMRNVKREISILKKLDHPNIIKLYYAIDKPVEVYSI